MVKEIKVMDIFLMNNTNLYKTFGKHLILILLKIFIIINWKKILLAHAFEKFIFTSLKYYNLNPCHYFSAPGLLWDAMLKMGGVTLEKISDLDKYMFFEQGMRVGVSYINKRYSETSKNKHILYLDMNNLYGCAMRQYLPISNFKWVKNR